MKSTLTPHLNEDFPREIKWHECKHCKYTLEEKLFEQKENRESRVTQHVNKVRSNVPGVESFSFDLVQYKIK